ncbi:hypothetical protein BU14_0025s0014 [Porphyra umbilicalis]|uniref:Uncharacterized protein n=1 Tax=Porphyra umbilicalis TaxID=2786 RepID=A0A1X6PJT9_PORUM|nr:hypothetical protein BU14_0025s0014 [Porphyra umbilicalis]|eukprot:OSX81132.1 hypothetical protein BU14_0025s0014 [Porphyra umbilicalis]
MRPKSTVVCRRLCCLIECFPLAAAAFAAAVAVTVAVAVVVTITFAIGRHAASLLPVHSTSTSATTRPGLPPLPRCPAPSPGAAHPACDAELCPPPCASGHGHPDGHVPLHGAVGACARARRVGRQRGRGGRRGARRVGRRRRAAIVDSAVAGAAAHPPLERGGVYALGGTATGGRSCSSQAGGGWPQRGWRPGGAGEEADAAAQVRQFDADERLARQLQMEEQRAAHAWTMRPPPTGGASPPMPPSPLLPDMASIKAAAAPVVAAASSAAATASAAVGNAATAAVNWLTDGNTGAGGSSSSAASRGGGMGMGGGHEGAVRRGSPGDGGVRYRGLGGGDKRE